MAQRLPSRDREIVDVAVELFYRQRYSNTSMEDIAQAVGILKGSLYHYISNKEDLLFQIVDEVHDDVERLARPMAANGAESPLERLIAYVRAQVEYNARNIQRVAIYHRDFDQLGEPRAARIRDRWRAHERFVAELIAEGQRRGEVDATRDVRLGAKAVFAMIIWMYAWYKPEGEVAPETLGEFCGSFVRSGLRGEAPGFGGIVGPPVRQGVVVLTAHRA